MDTYLPLALGSLKALVLLAVAAGITLAYCAAMLNLF